MIWIVQVDLEREVRLFLCLGKLPCCSKRENSQSTVTEMLTVAQAHKVSWCGDDEDKDVNKKEPSSRVSSADHLAFLKTILFSLK